MAARMPSQIKGSKRQTFAAADELTPNGSAEGNNILPVAAKRIKSGEITSIICKTKADKIPVIPLRPEMNEGNHDEENQGTRKVLVFDWTAEELTQLIENLTACLPYNDTVRYNTLIAKLDWEKVRFSHYSAAQCKEKWMQIVTKLRKFRTLTDMVIDAKEWLKHPWCSYNSSKKQKHPEMPRKPLTPYFQYFLEKREKYSKENPEVSMTDLAKLLSKKFSALPDKKKQKYKEAFEKQNLIYKQNLEKFKKCHPEQFSRSEVQRQAAAGPDKPHAAFTIFVSDMLGKTEFSEAGRKERMEKLRKQWSSLSDTKKMKYIRKAVQDEQRYGMEVEKYCNEHPDFHPKPVKPVLSKAEKELKNRCDGKPERPSNSGYSLFSKINLRKLKNIPSKLRMVRIAEMWKLLSGAERDDFNKQAQEAITKYKEEYATYLSKLPEEERRVGNETKSPKKIRAANHIPVEKYNKIADEAEKAYDEGLSAITKHETDRKRFKEEPRRPPQSGYELFSTQKLIEFIHVDPKNHMYEIAKAWQSLTCEEKDKYSIAVQEMNEKYTRDMQKFLKALTIAEFQEYEKYQKSIEKKRKNVPQGIKKIKIEKTNMANSEDSLGDSEKSIDADESASGSRSSSDSEIDDSDPGSTSDEDKNYTEQNDSTSGESDSGSSSDSTSEDTSDSDSESEEESG